MFEIMINQNSDIDFLSFLVISISGFSYKAIAIIL